MKQFILTTKKALCSLKKERNENFVKKKIGIVKTSDGLVAIGQRKIEP